MSVKSGARQILTTPDMLKEEPMSENPQTKPQTKPKMIFVNIPVADLARSVAFYEAVGATKNPQFSDDTAACMVISDTIYVMLLTHDKFSFFCKKKIIDAKTNVEALFCLSENSKDDVDATIDKAWAAGGKADPTAKQDYGFMYGRSFEDPDGHIWEVMWMDVEAAQQAMGADQTAAA
jgi:predicted lactoylglutathione lyase